MNRPPYKILLVEDNPGDVRLIEESLRARDIPYEITHCNTVRTALQMIKGYQNGGPKLPDLLLVDYNLPGGDARDVIQAAVENSALTRTPKAVITSSVSPRDRDDALRTGADSFIYKPADLDSFLTQIADAIQNLLSNSATESDGLAGPKEIKPTDR